MPITDQNRPAEAASAADFIRLRGASTRNLRSVNVDIPLGRFTVIAGVSGSGKSSLAFDTLFAEGRRRFLLSLSAARRSRLLQLPEPPLESLTGLPPVVCVDQRVAQASPRSIFASTAGIHDYLRLLWARAGTAHCTGCSKTVSSQSVDQIADRLMQFPDRTRMMVLAPLMRAGKGDPQRVIENIIRNGYVRARIDGESTDLSPPPDVESGRPQTIEAVIDRIILRDDVRNRLTDSLRHAVRESEGTCVVTVEQNGIWEDHFFSTRFSCPDCDTAFPAPAPALFRYGSAAAACPDCRGMGIQGIAEESDDLTVFRRRPCSTCRGSRLLPFASVIRFMGDTLQTFLSLTVSEAVRRVSDQTDNNDAGIMQQMSGLSGPQRIVAERTIPEILRRLRCLEDVGLGYLTLDRPTRTLSGGEYQRCRLASCLGTSLQGACFLLDEPTSGLHSRDTQQLLNTLLRLKDNGATVIVVEHDPDVISAADWLIDVGPGAGAEGGRIVYSGPPNDIPDPPQSPTQEWLNRTQGSITSARTEQRSAAALPQRITPVSGPELVIRNARLHNLNNVNAALPLKQFVCVTGVSGSGKSTLIAETLLPVAEAYFNSDRGPDEVQIATACADTECDSVDGLDQLSGVQSAGSLPAHRNERSCLATICGIWNEIRKLFASSRRAKALGLKSSDFSFNSGNGRCPECRGTGFRTVTLELLAPTRVRCEACRGRRFRAGILNVRFKGCSVADVLEMPAQQAAAVFGEINRISGPLELQVQAGLGYLPLGRPTSTYSGGEAQRVRLAAELAASRHRNTGALFILDEPTNGLHAADISTLTKLLRQLTETGNTIVAVEHNLQFIDSSDWRINLGPDSGPDGGRITYSGPTGGF